MQKTCIVIPCFNEANRLDVHLFRRFSNSHAHLYFLFVNDGSTDRTAALIDGLAEGSPHFSALHFAQNRGKAGAVRQGMLQALRWMPFDAIGYFDADLATPLQEIDWLLQHLQDDGVALAIGSRRKTTENHIHRNNLRHYFGRLYAGFITSLLSLDIYDTQCGAKIFRSDVVEALFREPFIDRWLFDVEVLCRLKKINAGTVREVVLREWTEKGHSRIRKSDFFSLPLKTAKIFLKYL